MGNDAVESRSDAAIHLSDFWSWWMSGLASVVPRSWREAFARPPHVISIRLLPGGYAVSANGKSAHDADTEAALGWDDALSAVRRAKRRWGPLLFAEVVVPADKCLLLDREVPARAMRQLDKILALELSRKAPFDPEELYAGHYILGQNAEPDAGAQRVRQVSVKRSMIDPLLDALASQSVPLSAIRVETPDGTRLPVNLLTREARKRGPAGITRWLDRLILCAGVAAAALAVLLIAAQIWRQTTTLAALEAELAGVRKQAVAVRRQMSDADAAIARAQSLHRLKNGSVKVLDIWEEVTRLLPSSVWLTDIRRDGDAVHLTGSAASASELIRTLSQSALFKHVAFVSPITRDAQGNTERFQIRMQLAHGDGIGSGDAKDGDDAP